MSCVFCEIVDKKRYAQVVRESESGLAIIPKEIECDGHILVIPKTHCASILDIGKKELSELMSFLQDTAAWIIKEHDFKGFNLMSANGKQAQQSIPHLHFHILPRKSANEYDAWPKLPGGINIYASTGRHKRA